MSTGEDDDVKLLRASASLIADLDHLLPRLLRTRKHGLVTVRLMHHVCSLIEPFQEDPQILDAHLKKFIPPLVASYLHTLTATTSDKPKKDSVPLSHAICYVLNIFCKVRGEKVIKGFFNNEPRYLVPILDELERGWNYQKTEDGIARFEKAVPWVERYVLLLWLSHLMLAPFPLESISGAQSSQETSALTGIELPGHAPAITLRVITICIERMRSASKERSAAANLLVKLCTRPDMQKLGLLDMLVKWCVSFLQTSTEGESDIHQSLGVLSFLSGLVASTTNEEIGRCLPSIYHTCRSILDQDHLSYIKSSAVARKFIVKIFRNIVVHCLHPAATSLELDSTTILEEVIEFLLEIVSDGDTPVRYGVSKALSVITLKLDSDMAGEVVEAILGSLNENVYWQGSERNLSGVDALRWHGLTLTLAQLLYREAISTSALPEVLNALLLSLSFEQRSPTGGSIGTNVRDAACFGVWALSRRYSTNNLLKVETASIRACEHKQGIDVPQALAVELLTVACLDPAGNIRRGSSAALQELIGRHPNTIHNGIPLVQVVDFHAVGLRQRAMCDVTIRAADLHPLYWEALFENLLSWRGTSSMDTESRLFAAKAIGSLSKSKPIDRVQRMTNQICKRLTGLRSREVEERQGLVAALAELVNMVSTLKDVSEDQNNEARTSLLHLWQLLETELKLEDKAFTSPALRPELTASSIAVFIAAMANLTTSLHTSLRPQKIPTTEAVHLLNLCLARQEESVLTAITIAVPSIVSLLCLTSSTFQGETVSEWLSMLENEASYSGLRCAGHAIAVGSAYSVLQKAATGGFNEAPNICTRIIRTLTFRCTAAVAIEARTVALRALAVLIGASHKLESQILAALHIALNDYTITERGDVGSLVRTQALESVGVGWTAGTLRIDGDEIHQKVYADVLRLSLEKLDKIRSVAARVLRRNPQHESQDLSMPLDDVSSAAYFLGALRMFESTNSSILREAICLGYMISAGMGSESVAQNARRALLSFLNTVPNDSETPSTLVSLAEVANCILGMLKNNIGEDRVVIPLLETIAFLFDMQVMQRLVSTSFNFRSLLSNIQKAHFKSTHVQKLHLALDVYRGLGLIPATASDTLTKVTSMLLHPFPKIRMSAAETLWILTSEDALKLQDWSLPSKTLKPAVDAIKSHIANKVAV
ncbi:tubulin folding cofactor D C terminal-domain-containing protein [Phaeosphaeria sp. MPI-PUGE-AT-0046c]|nr:tubulin folding cofactor D C terminal-domain-containing protein [Phaeosphaeria sp. MPI-PUGE-AT-0046c]